MWTKSTKELFDPFSLSDYHSVLSAGGTQSPAALLRLLCERTETMQHWYALYTKPNAEYQVTAALQKRQIATYLPEIELPDVRHRPSREPFFPCYLFIRVDFERISLSSVQWTPGLRHIVAIDSRPVPVPDEVINLIRRQLDEINATRNWTVHTFRTGETVQITDGPFQDMLAVFEGPSAPTKRVRVLLNILGHASRVWVPMTKLEKAPSDAEVPVPKRPRRTRGQSRYVKNR